MNRRHGDRFTLSDKQWAEITARLRLPDPARARIEDEINRYREIRATWRRPPGEVKKRLARIVASATKLEKLLNNLDKQERIELSEVWSMDLSKIVLMGGGGAYSPLDSAIIDVRRISIACRAASDNVSRFSKAEQAISLVDWMDGILQEFADRRVSQEQAVLSFLNSVYKFANGRRAEGTVAEAVKKLIRSRGEKPTKKSSKASVVRTS